MRSITPGEPTRRVLKLLDNVRPSGDGWSSRCPAHDDRRSSLSIAEGDDGRVLLNCHAGCETAEIIDALGLKKRDLFPRSKGIVVGDKSPTSAGLTLQEYATVKRLPVKFLRRLGITEVYSQQMPVVRIPYMDMHGSVVSARLRLSLKNDPRFVWKTGSKPLLYGLWHRKKKSKYVCLVEGESDCHTLWRHRFPALGLPGAATWKEDWSVHFDGV
jgi:hypothetical protein